MSEFSSSRPSSKTLDWYASVAAGWSPASRFDAPFCFGELSCDVMTQTDIFQALICDVEQSSHSHLLSPMVGVVEPDIFPEVLSPTNEEMVVIDPLVQTSTGLYPKAVVWQSGWPRALPYIFVRRQVYERLLAAVRILREFNPDLSLCITDGWRSVDQQSELFKAFYPSGYIQGDPIYVSAPNEDDRLAAPHPSGGAVDVMIGINDQAFHIGSELDYMDVEANTDYFENEADDHFIRDMRRVFTNLLCDVGFVSHQPEWWHVEYGTRRWAGKTGNDPRYGNVIIDPTLYADVEPVVPIARSRRAAMMSS